MLVVDDEPLVLRAVSRMVETLGYTPRLASSGAEALASVRAAPPDVILTDLHLGDITGIELMAAVRKELPDAVIIVMTGRATISSAVEAIRKGAYDYLVKPFEDLDTLHAALARAVEHQRLVDRNRYLEARLGEDAHASTLVGSSAEMRRVVSLVQTVGPTDASVLVLGESGTGKELVVRAIHQASRRRDKPFVAVNCGALAESVLESELFGHVKGAFTGALGGRKGLFEEAAGGTIFLDEVGELPPGTQVRLLRVLQEREVKPVGGNQSKPVDIRVIAATNRDLSAEVAAGRFRQDLYYRLNVIVLAVPPLRARVEDVPLLAVHFLRKHAARHGRKVARIEPSALTLLSRTQWPGNVRELENAMERTVVLCQGDSISEADLAGVIRVAPGSDETPPPATPFSLPLAAAKHEFERSYLVRLMLQADGSLAAAARSAGLDRSNLRRLLRRFRINTAGA